MTTVALRLTTSYLAEQLLEIIRTEVTRIRCSLLLDDDDIDPPAVVPEAEPAVEPVVPLVVPAVLPEPYEELLELSRVPVTSISCPEWRDSSLVSPSRTNREPLIELDEPEPYDEVPLVPDVPLVVPAVVPLPVVEPVDPDIEEPLEPVPMCAFVRTQLPLAGAELAVELVPVVLPEVPVVLLVLPAGCRHPVTVTVLLELDVDDVLDVPVCAYPATAAPTTNAIAAPQTLRFMCVPPSSRRDECNGVTSPRSAETPVFTRGAR